MKKWLWVFLFMWCMISTAKTDEVTLAVMEMDPVGVSKDTAQIVTELLHTELFKTSLFDMVERRQIRKVLEEYSLQLAGLTGDEYEIRLGQLLSADKVLVGTVGKLGDSFIINARIIDVEKGTMDFAESTKVESESELDNACAEFAQELITLMLSQGIGSSKSSVKSVSSDPRFALNLNPLALVPTVSMPLISLEIDINGSLSINIPLWFNLRTEEVDTIYKNYVTDYAYYTKWRIAALNALLRYYIYPKDLQSFNGFWVEAGVGIAAHRGTLLKLEIYDYGDSTVTNDLYQDDHIAVFFTANIGYKFLLGSGNRFYIEPWIGYVLSPQKTFIVQSYEFDNPIVGLKGGIGFGLTF